MSKIKKLLRKAFTPVTIMLIPHSNRKAINLKIPSIGVIVSILLWFVGSVYVLSIAVNAVEYRRMKDRVNYYSAQFLELKTTMSALKKAESEFRRLFSLGSKEQVLENVHSSDSGSVDIQALSEQIERSMETVKEIREYLSQQKDIYSATPKGLPVDGNITSHYGMRENPLYGGDDFHSGIDISVQSGTPIHATADGVVSFAARNGGSGNLVGIEHGFGFSTFYAHNKAITVRVGQRVKRGDIIAHAGSTGISTGTHSHYEIWKDRKHVNPKPYLEGGK